MGPRFVREFIVTSTFQRCSLAIAIAIGLVLLWPLHTAGVVVGLWQPLTRPPSVSRSARYVTLVEDGTWFECIVDTSRNVNKCRAWTSEGLLIADGEFQLEDENRAATQEELKPSRVAVSEGRVHWIDLFGKGGAFSKRLLPVQIETKQ